MTRLQEINARGWAKGWYADMLAIHAKHSGLTMAEQFVKQIEHASAFNVPAPCIKIKGRNATYRFADQSTATFLLPEKK